MAPEKESSSPSQSSSLLHFLRYILFGAFGVWFLSKLGAPTQNSDESYDRQYRTPNESARSESIPPRSRRIDVGTVPPSNRPPAQGQSDQGSNDPSKQSGRLVQWLIFLATAIYAAIAFGQWRAQINALKVDQRAWIGLEKPMVAEKINYPGPELTWGRENQPSVVHPGGPNPLIHTGVSIKNFGKTPAFDVFVSVFSTPKDLIDAQSNVQCQFAEDFSTGKVIRDSKRTDLKWPTMGKTIFPGQPIFEPEDVPGGDIPRMSVVGCIAYRDIFNERHKTRFCYRSPQVFATDPDMKDGDAFVQCNAYNDAN